MAAVMSSKVTSPKMLLEQDGFSKASKLFPGLTFATESVSELFKLPYPNLFKNLSGYLNPVTFFHFVILSVWLFLLLRITFYFRIVEEEKKMFKQVTPEADLGLLQHPRWSSL